MCFCRMLTLAGKLRVKSWICVLSLISVFTFKLIDLTGTLGFSVDGPSPHGGAGGGPLRFGRPQAPRRRGGPFSLSIYTSIYLYI